MVNKGFRWVHRVIEQVIMQKKPDGNKRSIILHSTVDCIIIKFQNLLV